jgi:endoglucanase
MRNTQASVSFVDANTIQLRLDLGTILQGAQTTTRPPGGTVGADGWLTIDNKLVGRVSGPNGEYFMPLDTFRASSLADLFKVSDVGGTLRAAVDAPGRWTVMVNGAEVEVELVSRKSHILDTARTDIFGFDFATTENVFLRLATPLKVGDDISIKFDDADFTPLTADYVPAQVVSEAIHVNLQGFDPNDAHKVAYLSSWNGWSVDASDPEGGNAVPTEFRAGTDWRVVNSETGQTVLRGQIEMFQDASAGTKGDLNFQGTDVWAIDFSALDDAGTYHVVVQGVGRSNDFEVADTHWDELYELGMSGYYNQRSGIALDEPFTNWERPSSMSPQDGQVIYETTLKLSDTNMGYDLTRPSPFDLFDGAMTGRTVTDAWGGWHDAGDWDRRTPHLETVRKMTELWELSGRYQEISNLSIPENGDAIPDVLNEALWTLDMFRRLQNADGGVSGGIESEEHPRFGDGSWGESLRVFTYAADAWTTYEYAAAAAKMANALEGYDPTLAATYRASALKAMTWAEANRPTGEAYDTTHQTSRNLAAAELYALTGNERWNTLYQATTVYDGDTSGVQWFEHQYEAAFVYARIDRPGVNTTLAQAGENVLLAEATRYATEWDTGGFGYSLNPYAPHAWGQSGQSMDEAADFFIRAHALTGQQRWLTEAQSEAQYLLGANPLNMSFLTGLNGRGPERILNVDAETMGEGPPPGITIYGDYNIRDLGYDWFHGVMDPAVWPNFYDIPVTESFNAFEFFVPSTEYTVMQGMQDTMFVTGYLAAQGMRNAIRGTAGADTLDGTGRDDIFLGGQRGDLVRGAAGDDRAGGGSGNDTLVGDAGNDSLFGEAGEDQVRGGSGNDVVIGGAGIDGLRGGAGNDVVIGGTEADVLNGNDGNDTLLGGAAADRLLGDVGRDILWGDAGRDTLSGGAGRDSLSGGTGTDDLRGGTAADEFVYKKGWGRDTIRDFRAGEDAIVIDLMTEQTEGQMLTAYGALSADRLTYTLTFSATDVLIIESTTALTRATIAAAVELI